MIKFFRRIRGSLIQENKVGKYFKYAIGEIILVMIGILLALQVNNWNEDRKSKKAKSVYINRLINDLKSDTTAFSYHIKNVQSKADDGKFIMSIIKENEPVANSKEFVLRLQNVGRVNVPKKANNTYLDLQSSGNLKLFENDTVVNAIRNYYITNNDFWYSLYVDRTTEGYLPIITDVLPFRIAEEIVNSEIRENQYLSRALDYDIYNISISDTDLDLILDRLNTNPTFYFHLKNATRAHLLQVRVEREGIKQAAEVIELLNDLKT